MSAKIRVAGYHLDGKLAGIYKSMMEAGRENYISDDSIRNCINGRSRTAGDMFWIKLGFEEEAPKKLDLKSILKKNYCYRPVRMLSKRSGKVLSEFESITEAERVMGIASPEIVRSCRGFISEDSIRAGGYKWEYVENKRD